MLKQKKLKKNLKRKQKKFGKPISSIEQELYDKGNKLMKGSKFSKKRFKVGPYVDENGIMSCCVKSNGTFGRCYYFKYCLRTDDNISRLMNHGRNYHRNIKTRYQFSAVKTFQETIDDIVAVKSTSRNNNLKRKIKKTTIDNYKNSEQSCNNSMISNFNWITLPDDFDDEFSEFSDELLSEESFLNNDYSPENDFYYPFLNL